MKIYVKKNYYKQKEYESYTHKKCSNCSELKLIHLFGKNNTPKSRLRWTYRSWCIDCNKISCRKYGTENRERRNKRLREYRKKYPEKARLYDKRGRIKSKYGISLDQLDLLKMANGYRCWICNQNREKLFVDHCHSTNKIRGVLCPLCNTYLGVIKDSVDAAERIKKYLLGQSSHADVLLKIAKQENL